MQHSLFSKHWSFSACKSFRPLVNKIFMKDFIHLSSLIVCLFLFSVQLKILLLAFSSKNGFAVLENRWFSFTSLILGLLKHKGIYGSRYSRMDQVKIVEDSLFDDRFQVAKLRHRHSVATLNVIMEFRGGFGFSRKILRQWKSWNKGISRLLLRHLFKTKIINFSYFITNRQNNFWTSILKIN